MEPEFWQKRWERDQIGFHLSEVNPYLQQFWPHLGLTPGARVLVPLCGKSLHTQHLTVTGLSLIELTALRLNIREGQTCRSWHRGRTTL